MYNKNIEEHPHTHPVGRPVLGDKGSLLQGCSIGTPVRLVFSKVAL